MNMNAKILIILLIFFFVSSCSKLSYIYDQGIGQIQLLTKARDNDQILSDVSVPSDMKEKIKLIQVYKNWFYEYFERKPDSIYTKTTLLEGDAVTYLVILSPYNQIKAKDHCFTFLGCFPYIGFFSKQKAYDFVQRQQQYSSYVRQVYAYSTLGFFEDPILSSFFHYDDYDLAELVFHELFHTIFFVKNEVDFNESMADFFALKLQETYFFASPDFERKRKIQQIDQQIKKTIHLMANHLQQKYDKNPNLDKNQSQALLEDFLQKEFKPAITAKCQELQIESCYPLSGQWNNARFAAFLTYEEKGDSIEKLFNQKGLKLKAFFEYCVAMYEEYQKQRPSVSFQDFLFKEKMKEKI